VAIPIFMLLLLGLIEGGRLVVANNTVSQAAREAARLATVQAAFVGATGPACSAPVCPATSSALRTNVVAAANRMTAFIGPVTSANLFLTCTALGSAPTGVWTSGNDCASTNTSGNVVSVRIVVPIEALTPLFEPFSPESVSGAATMAIP
jgi:Flp pilus assembly protein TadG